VFVAPPDYSGLQGVSQRSILRRFLRDLTTLEACDVFIQTEEKHKDWVRDCLPEQHPFDLRTDGPAGRSGLPRKVESVFRNRFEDGYERVLSVAADTPGLDAERIRDALRSLRTEKSTATVGPSRDGGFYLLGVNSHESGFLEGVPFYVNSTFRCLMDRLKSLYDQIRTLDRLRDVDRPTDWFSIARRWLMPFQWILELVQRVLWFAYRRTFRVADPTSQTLFLARSYRSPPLPS
jgi:hypothetical protein